MEKMMIPRYYQTEAANAAFDAVKDGETHPVIVMPTGAGKSLTMCLIVERIMDYNINSKILILSHVQEILEQDYDSLSNYFEGITFGLYSSGLGEKTIKRITIAGIQSVFRKPERFEDVDFILIDEAHMVPMKENSMYRSFLSKLPEAICIGLTATHFRLGHGYIHEGKDALFNSICYDLSEPEKFKKLQDEGFLSKLITKATIEEMDKSNLKITAGDYNVKAMVDRFDRSDVTNEIVDEIIKYGKNYKKWLVFAIDISHAEHIAEQMNHNGISTACVHSKMEDDREQIIKDIKSGKYRCVVNVDILTTGFDVPDIDLIAMARPTKSPVLHVQAIGRGLRVANGKKHCLVLDFAGNTEELGPIDNVHVRKKGKSGKGEAITKRCPDCMVIHHAAVRECDVCGHKFLFKHGLETTASGSALTSQHIKPEWVKVDDVQYSITNRAGKPNSLRVTYKCGVNQFSEWINLQHKGYAKHCANEWVRFRTNSPTDFPNLELATVYQYSHLLKTPKQILVDINGKWPEIRDMLF